MTADRPRAAGRPVTIGWSSLVPVIGSYLLLRYVIDSRLAVIASQVVFLLPLALAAVVMFLASAQARKGSRARSLWAILSAACACLLAAEMALSASEVFSVHGIVIDGVFDTMNFLAMTLLFIGSAVAAGLDHIDWRRSLRFAFDAIAILALVFGVIFRFLGAGYLARTGDLLGMLRFSGYALIAFALFEAGTLVFGNSYALRAPWNRVLATALAFIALAATVWALSGFWGSDTVADEVSAVCSLTGYFVLMMAGVHRLAHVGRVWSSSPLFRIPAAWPGFVLSSSVLMSVLWLTYLAATAPPGSTARVIYTGALSVGAIAMVARAALDAAESFQLTDRSMADPVTDVMGPMAMDRAWTAVCSEARRLGRQAVAFSVDMDDFAQVNAARGFGAGDRCLSEAARAIEWASGSGAWVIRFADDEFVVFTVVRDRVEAQTLGARLCSVLKNATHVRGLSASVGSSLCPDGECDAIDLVRQAMVARTWAKRQGKGRYAEYDSEVAEALMLDDRLARGREAGRDMARALVAAQDARDPDSHDHARNVAALSRMLAADVGLGPEHVERVEMAAVLHDVGKIALPNVMLGGRTLSAKERTVAAEHSELGETLLEFLSGEGIPGWVRSHHERWDGEGFPDGLRGEDIPLESRIIALADAYDAMTAGRRYGAPMSKAAALQEIDLGMGARFDPVLAERFITLVGTSGAMGWSDDWSLS